MLIYTQYPLLDRMYKIECPDTEYKEYVQTFSQAVDIMRSTDMYGTIHAIWKCTRIASDETIRILAHGTSTPQHTHIDLYEITDNCYYHI